MGWLKTAAYQRKLAEEGVDPVALAGGAAAAALPVASMFNKDVVLNAQNVYDTYDDVLRHARPGDVVVTGGPRQGIGQTIKELLSDPKARQAFKDTNSETHNTIKKMLVSLGSGSEAHHSGVVGKDGKFLHHTLDGLLVDDLDYLGKQHGKAWGENVTLLRPRGAKHTADLVNLGDEIMAGTSRFNTPYSRGGSVSSGLLNTLIPDKVQEWVGKLRNNTAANCTGGFCSNTISGAAQRNYGAMSPNLVVPQHIMNATDEFDQIATTIKKPSRFGNIGRQVLRAGTALGLGYGAYKGIKGLRNYFAGDDDARA